MGIARRAAAVSAGALLALTVAVTPADSASAGAATPTCDLGAPTSTAYAENFEAGAPGWDLAPSSDWRRLSTGTPGTDTYAGHGSLWGHVPPGPPYGGNDTSLTVGIRVPTGPAFLTFWHRDAFATKPDGTPLDGGQLLASTDGGQYWYDLGPRMIDNPYSGTLIGPAGPNPAFVGRSAGWTATRVDLSTMAGLSVRLQFLLLPSYQGETNWYIDDLALYGCAPAPTTSRIVLDTNPNLSATQVLARQPGSNAVLGATFSGRPTTAWADLGGKSWAAPAADTKTGQVAVRGLDNAVWVTVGRPGAGPTRWVSLGGLTYWSPAIVTDPSGQTHVFVTGLDHALWENVSAGGRWSGWRSRGGGLLSGPAALWGGGAELRLVAVGLDRAVWLGFLIHSWNTGGLIWGWSSVGGRTNHAPSIAADAGTGVMVVAVRGTDGALWVRRGDPLGSGAWASLGGVILDGPSLGSIPGQLTAVARGGDRRIWQRTFFDSSTWSGWQPG